MENTISLNSENLKAIAKRIPCPTYDRSKIKTGIVHVGIGGFHRAHQAFYTDLLLQDYGETDWGICGVALLDSDDRIYNVLKRQDGLYTLMIKELDGSLTLKIIGSIIEYLFAPENPRAVIEKMAHAETKIITLTITEGGYNYDESTGEFIFDHPDIRHDLAHPNVPKTIFGYLAQAFKLRKQNGANGCTIQSCDNIQGNGQIAQKMMVSYLQRAEPDLVEWVRANIAFPNSMVDRITPVTEPTDIQLLLQKTGVEDDWPVVCEPFRQWVIEDDFRAGRPAWGKVGAQFVEDVVPYERMKLSLLNAGHSVLGILGALVGYKTIDEVIDHQKIKSFLVDFMDEEATPSLGALAGIDLTQYKKSLIARFGNQNIKDQVSRICSESSAKIPKFILPTVKYQLENEGDFERSAFVIAAWAIYSLGKDENGNTIEIRDGLRETLKEKAIAAKQDPIIFLNIAPVFGDINSRVKFVAPYLKAYRTISKKGTITALSQENF